MYVKEKCISSYAPAKLNLYLDIVGKRENGYHEISSVMQTVDLCDTVKTEVFTGSGIEVLCDSAYAPSGESNIAYKAAEKYISATGTEAKVRITVEKKIPSPAGMGGGSSDAAAVLRALNEIFGAMDEKALMKTALDVGSDVPFCVSGGTALVGGIGENIEPLTRLPHLTFLICCGKEKIKTSEAYRALDEKYGDFGVRKNDGRISGFIRSLDEGNIDGIASGMFNIFEETAEEKIGAIARLKEIMLENGAAGAMMSGSGPSVFGIFEDDVTAGKAMKKIESEFKGIFAAVCHPIN